MAHMELLAAVGYEFSADRGAGVSSNAVSDQCPSR
jgi:hypothetical protein